MWHLEEKPASEIAAMLTSKAAFGETAPLVTQRSMRELDALVDTYAQNAKRSDGAEDRIIGGRHWRTNHPNGIFRVCRETE
jgi:hypothetical protein